MASHFNETCDVLVLGSGAAGLTASATAALAGLRVILLEKAAHVGGATAWSGGWVWLPGDGDTTDAARYLTGFEGIDPAVAQSFADVAPKLLGFLENHTRVRFQDAVSLPDYEPGIPGYLPHGRSRVVAPLDGRGLGRELRRLRCPLPQLTLAGLMPSAGTEMRHFVSAGRSLRSMAHVARRLAAHGLERLFHGRAVRLTNGTALAGGLFQAALDAGVCIRTDQSVQALVRKNGRVSGVRLADREIVATRGVILATGGFSANPVLRRQYYPHVAREAAHHTMAPIDNAGDGVRLAQAIGAVIADRPAGAGAWVPVSLIPGRELRPFPHFADRAKPGLIAVRRNGRRFVNEAAPYFEFMAGLFAATPDGEDVEAWLICDHRFQRRYGLGFSKPFPLPVGPYVRSGYLRRAPTLERLATDCGVDPEGFKAAVDEFNAGAVRGEDPAFGRGETPVNRAQGDPSQMPNPCVAPILTPPFYAVRVVPGCLGSFAGLKTDPHARVLDRDDAPIPGLYACGSDMASIMGGHYPAGGISLGPALVFGHIAGHAAANIA